MDKVKLYLGVLITVLLYGCSHNQVVIDEKHLSYLDQSITQLNSEEEFVRYLEKLVKFGKADNDYNAEKKALSKVRVWGRRKTELVKGYNNSCEDCQEIVVTGTRATIQSSIGQKRIPTEIVDGLSADEIGGIPALSIGEALETVTGASSDKEKESITNNQEKNVDQGDIVKRVGDYLIVLRKGVIYSLKIKAGQSNEIELVSTVNLQGVESTHDAWYDELLVSGDKLIVTGFSYGEHDGAELVFFNMDEYGHVEFNQRYFIASDDYYDDENSATRIIGTNLIMVLPSYLSPEETLDVIGEDKSLRLPAVRYFGNAALPEKINIANDWKWANIGAKPYWGELGFTLVLSCPLENLHYDNLQCNITSLLGVDGYSSEFYVSPNAVYIWSENEASLNYQRIPITGYEEFIRSDSAQNLQDRLDKSENYSSIYRIDLQSNDVSAVNVDGRALNQYSFQERGNTFSAVAASYYDDVFKVNGISFDLSEFKMTHNDLPKEAYTSLIKEKVGHVSANRFMGNNVFLANNIGTWRKIKKRNVVVWNRLSNKVSKVSNAFNISAFHPQGHNMLAMGKGENRELALQTFETKAKLKSLDLKFFKHYSPSESRSVAFNSTNYRGGTVFGIPVNRFDDEGNEVEFKNIDGYMESYIDIAYFNNPFNSAFTEIGQLKQSEGIAVDNCIVSCDEWYGVARPFFINGNIYALIDDELVKGKLDAGVVKTLSRLNLITGEVSFE